MAARVEIPGCARQADPQHERVGEVDRDKLIEVTVCVPAPSGSLDWVAQEAGRPPSERRTIWREDFADAIGASDEDIAAVRSFAGEYTPPEVAAAYNFPSGTNGSGQTSAILELGSGFSQAALDTYFTERRAYDGERYRGQCRSGHQLAGHRPDADGEVLLAIEVLGAVAQGAKILVYFAPNTDQGFVDALSTAVHDATNNSSVVSISWGGSEDSWAQQARTQMEQFLTDGAAARVTVTMASGDSGSTDGEQTCRLSRLRAARPWLWRHNAQHPERQDHE